MKINKIILLGAFLGITPIIADDHMLSSSVDDGLTFYCSFDNTINATKAIGNAKGISHFKNQLQFTPGVKNNGLRIGKSSDGKNKFAVIYNGLKNINHAQGTISFWIKPEDWNPTSKDFAVFLTGLKKNGCFFIYKYQGNSIRFHIKDDNKTSNSMANNSAFEKGKWYYLTAAWNSQMQQLYINGKLIQTAKRPQNSEQPYTNFIVGSRNWAVEKGYSIIDELKIFNRVLSQAEIEKEYMSVAGIDRTADKMLIRVGKSTPKIDGVITKGEYSMNGTGVFTSLGKYSNRQGVYYLSWDDKNLYIGVDTQQNNHPVTKQTGRDSEVWNDDSIELWLSKENGKRYQIIYNSKGTIFDACHQKKSDSYWNIKNIKIANKISNKRWISEIQIPMEEIGYKTLANQTLKLNIGRTFQADKPRAFVCLAPVRRKYGFSDVDRYPEITFDASLPKYEICNIGNINKGLVNINIKAPNSYSSTVTYSTSERVWFKDTFGVKNKQIVLQKSFAPGGNLGLQIKNKDKIIFQADYQGEAPSAVSVSYIYTDRKKNILQSVAKNEGNVNGSLLLTLTDKKSKKVYSKKVPVTAEQMFWTIPWDIKKLPVGDYTYKAQFLDKNNTPSGNAFLQWYRKSPSPTAWDNNKIGIYPGFVPKPWKAMEYQNNTIITMMQKYRFNGTLLPSEFTANGHQILTSPCRIRINGKYLEKGTVKLLEKKPDYLRLQTEAIQDQIKIICDIKAEFDGMLWFDLSINGKKVKVYDFIVEIPLKKEFAEQVHSNDGDTHTALFGATGLIPPKGWHKNLYKKPAFWVGSDFAGFAWYAENLKGWKNKDKNKSVEIIPGKTATIVKLNVIDRDVNLNGLRKLSFGFHGTPVKKADTSPRSNRMLREWGWSYMTHYFNYLDGGKEFFDKNYWENQKNRYAEKKANRFFLYIASNGAGPYNPEWAYWGKEWTSRPMGDYIIEYNIKDIIARNKWVWTYSCLNSKSFREFYIWQLNNVLRDKKIDIQNLYYDLVGPRMCNNSDHGCGWYDDDGLLWPTQQISGSRDFHKRIVMLTQKILPDCKHLYHVTGQPVVPAVHSFCDGIVEGETSFGQMLPEKETYFGIIEPKMFRAGYTGEKWGYPTIFIPQLQRSAYFSRPDKTKYWKMENAPEKYVRAATHFLGYALTHDISLWYAEKVLDVVYDPLWKKQAKFMDKWDDKVEFIPYWRKNNPFKVESNTPQRVFMSAYKKNNKAMLVVMNDTNLDQKVKISIDPQKLLNQKNISHIEDEKGVIIPSKNSFTGIIPRQVFKIYYIK